MIKEWKDNCVIGKINLVFYWYCWFIIICCNQIFLILRIGPVLLIIKQMLQNVNPQMWKCLSDFYAYVLLLRCWLRCLYDYWQLWERLVPTTHILILLIRNTVLELCFSSRAFSVWLKKRTWRPAYLIQANLHHCL